MEKCHCLMFSDLDCSQSADGPLLRRVVFSFSNGLFKKMGLRDTNSQEVM
jgi:hypothetical protein